MPRNVEVKVRIANLDDVRIRVARLGAKHEVTQDQVDRYYEIDGGRRLKLRTFAGVAQMIAYDRPETDGIRPSEYTVTAVRDAAAGACLVPKGDPLVVVRKHREIYLLDNVRIHLDRVDGLGTFLELEAVVGPHHDEANCRMQVAEILRGLGLQEAEPLALSYSDLARAPSR